MKHNQIRREFKAFMDGHRDLVNRTHVPYWCIEDLGHWQYLVDHGYAELDGTVFDPFKEGTESQFEALLELAKLWPGESTLVRAMKWKIAKDSQESRQDT